MVGNPLSGGSQCSDSEFDGEFNGITPRSDATNTP